mgnify:CR=1 FL=1
MKPARSGSSFGVSKVSGKEELLSAVETARQYDSKVLIEEAVVGSEVGCAILGNDLGLIAGEVDRIALSHGFFKIHQESDGDACNCHNADHFGTSLVLGHTAPPHLKGNTKQHDICRDVP